MTAIINRLFGALLEELHAYGGIVLKFGGDALTGFFDAQSDPEHSVSACAAALAMQRRMAEFADLTVGGRTFHLQLRVGVHRGNPFGAIVGDSRRSEVVVTGRAVNRVALMQERAAPGMVVISAETLAGLPGAHSTAQLGGYTLLAIPPVAPKPLPPLPPLPAAHDLPTLETLAGRIAELRPFLPAPLPRHVLFPAERAGGEFRPVSALFVNVSSLSGVLTLLEEIERPAVQILTSYYGRIQNVIHRYGGEIHKVDINSVGDKLLVVFGAPIAHDDDPQRAVEAALDLAPALREANSELRRFLDTQIRTHENEAVVSAGDALWRAVDLSLRQRIGIATGNVFAGTVGSQRRREYTVIGRVVNLAARLMAVAQPGSVVVAPATARAVRDMVHLEPMPPIALKGFGRKIVASVVQRSDETPVPLRAIAPLVDRSAELLLLRGLARATCDGSGRVAVISGEAGIGKSRLIAAFEQELAAQVLRRISLRARAYAQHTPYSLVRDLLTQLFDLPEHAAPDFIWTELADAVAQTAPEFTALTPLLETVFAIGPPDETVITAFDLRSELIVARLPELEQRERLHDLIVALLVGAIQHRPLALVIDDLHWADASSRDLIQRLAQLAQNLPLLLVLSYRSNLLPTTPWLELPQTHALQLEGLDRAGSRRLLAHLLESQSTVGLEPILERAQGSPFFLEALVRHLIDHQILRRDEAGIWRLLKPLAEAGVPETIELLLAAQIDQLDEPTRELVQVAAVIGPSIPYRVLAGVYSQSRQPARHLIALVQAGILVSDAQEAKTDFHFRQTMLRDVVYQGILYAERRGLHRRVAERIEMVFAPQLDRFAAELSDHYARAEIYDRACMYALRAARGSRAQYALSEAIASYRRAWTIATRHPGALDPAEVILMLEELADVEVQAGHYNDAHRHYRVLLDDAHHLAAPDLRIAVLLRKIGAIYEQQSLFEPALEWLHQARRLFAGAAQISEKPALNPSNSAAGLELSRIAGVIGWVYFRRGEPERAQQWLDEALRVLPAAEGESPELLEERARTYNRLGGVAWMMGNLQAARRYVERSLADFSALDDRSGKADAQNNLGILAEQLGDWHNAIASYQAALAANRRSGRRRAAALSMLNLGAAHLQSGEPEVALSLLEQASAETQALGDAIHEIMALRWLGRALTRMQRFDAARTALSRALSQARQHQLLLEQLDTFTALGELALSQSDWSAARSAYAGGEPLLAQVDQETLEVGLFLQFAAQVEEQRGDPDRGAVLRSRSRHILETLGLA
ncbi:MAG: tetratricopeptide repeat protein [Oscillochloris sp.]|nr:tetratricopeptide repeat protein [Oscillochloris sp.]